MDKKNLKLPKEKKVVFDEETDSFISGIALGIACVVVAGFVILFEVFENAIANRIISVILITFGILGTLTELNKIKSKDIKGGSDFIVGISLTLMAVLVIFSTDKLVFIIAAFLVIIIGAFGMVRGILEIGYSIMLHMKNGSSKKIEVTKFIVAGTEIIALIVAILQLIKECIM